MNRNLYTALFLILILIVNFSTFAQDKGVIAKSEYMTAESTYSNGDYEKSLKHLDNAQEMVGNNRLIQYLRVKSYYNLKDYPRTKEELTLYFEVTDKKYSDTEEYEEMVGMIAPVNEAVDRQANIGGEAYGKIKDYLSQGAEYLSQGNTKEANRNVFNAFQVYEDQLQDKVSIEQLKTVFDKELKELINIAYSNPTIYFNEELYTFYSEVIEVGSQTWMGEEILVNTALLDGSFNTIHDDIVIKNDFDLQRSATSYFILNKGKSWPDFSICPEGFRIPENTDMNTMGDFFRNFEGDDNSYYRNKKKYNLIPRSGISFGLLNNGFLLNGRNNYYININDDFVKKLYEKEDLNGGKKTGGKTHISKWISLYVFKKGSMYTVLYRNNDKENAKGYLESGFLNGEYWNDQGFCRCIKE